jgi:hypothetical protein
MFESDRLRGKRLDNAMALPALCCRGGYLIRLDGKRSKETDAPSSAERNKARMIKLLLNVN